MAIETTLQDERAAGISYGVSAVVLHHHREIFHRTLGIGLGLYGRDNALKGGSDSGAA